MKTILLPGSRRALRQGIDDELIQRESFENVWALEKETGTLDNFYVSEVEQFTIPLSEPEKGEGEEEGKKRKVKPVLTSRSQNLIVAKTMLEAIRKFEEECGKRVWLADGPANERQIGSSRIANGASRLVRIQKIRKDCVLS